MIPGVTTVSEEPVSTASHTRLLLRGLQSLASTMIKSRLRLKRVTFTARRSQRAAAAD